MTERSHKIEESAKKAKHSEMNHYIELGAKRQRLCEMDSSETMSIANRACEVFMRWYLDERIHQAIDDYYQSLEEKIRFCEWEYSLHKMYPKDYKAITAKRPG